MTLLDCAIIGGGPAGSNAALVLGRARKNVVLFDENKPANRVLLILLVEQPPRASMPQEMPHLGELLN